VLFAYPCRYRVIGAIRVLAVTVTPDHTMPEATVDDRAAGVLIVVIRSTASVHDVQIAAQ